MGGSWYTEGISVIFHLFHVVRIRLPSGPKYQLHTIECGILTRQKEYTHTVYLLRIVIV